MRRFLLPLGLFIVLAGFLAVGLGLNPREVPSPLIGKPAPEFRLSKLHQPDVVVTPADLKGQVWLLNVWASWCVSCRQEHPVLVDLARHKLVTMVGLDYKDGRDAAKAWLVEHGDPYTFSLFDGDGRVGIDYGVYGVPETFLVDRDGIIRYKHIGPLTDKAVKEKIVPLLKELNRA